MDRQRCVWKPPKQLYKVDPKICKVCIEQHASSDAVQRLKQTREVKLDEHQLRILEERRKIEEARVRAEEEKTRRREINSPTTTYYPDGEVHSRRWQ